MMFMSLLMSAQQAAPGQVPRGNMLTALLPFVAWSSPSSTC